MGLKDKILSALREKTSEVFCTSLSGCQGISPVDVQEEAGVFWPEAHRNAEKMTKLAIESQKITGLKNTRVPFDNCLEPEAFGAEVKWGDKSKDPYIREYPNEDDPESLEIPDEFLDRGRFPLVLDAIERINKEVGGEIPISSLVMGPFTLIGELVSTEKLMRMTLRQPKLVEELVNSIIDVPIKYGNAQYGAGSDVVQVVEPNASADMIPPNLFSDFVKPALTEIRSNLNGISVLHICGDAQPLLSDMKDCEFDGISIGAEVNIARARSILGEEVSILGNISPKTLVNGTPEDVKKEVKSAIEQGTDFVEPDDGFSAITPKENILTMIKTTEEYST